MISLIYWLSHITSCEHKFNPKWINPRPLLQIMLTHFLLFLPRLEQCKMLLSRPRPRSIIIVIVHTNIDVGTGNRCPHGGPPEMRGPPEVGSPQENGRYCKFRHPVCVHPLLQISPGQYVCSKYMAFCNNTHHELIYRELREYGSSQMVPTNVGYPKPTRRYKSEMPPRSRTNYRRVLARVGSNGTVDAFHKFNSWTSSLGQTMCSWWIPRNTDTHSPLDHNMNSDSKVLDGKCFLYVLIWTLFWHKILKNLLINKIDKYFVLYYLSYF